MGNKNVYAYDTYVAHVHLGLGIFFHGGVFFSFFFFWISIKTLPKIAPGPKNSLERRALQFYTIFDKNQLLNKSIGKVMVILVLRCQKLGHSMHHRDPGPVPAAYWSCIWRTLAERDLKNTKNELYRRVSMSATICSRN
jgi:hypothetical protein